MAYKEKDALELLNAAKTIAQMDEGEYLDFMHELEERGWNESEELQKFFIAWADVIDDIRNVYNLYGQPEPKTPTRAS